MHYLTLTGNYALSASKLRYLLEQDTMFGCGIGYGLDSMFGPLEEFIAPSQVTREA